MKKNIVTGQQIGIGGGALYTTYKVIGAAFLAKKQGGRAIYWMETNDADFEEISSLSGIDGHGNLFTLKWLKKTGGKRVGAIQVDQNLLDVFEKYFNTIEQTIYTKELKRKVMQCYQLKEPLQVSSSKLAKWLFGFLPIEYFSPDDSLFRKFSHPFLVNEINRVKGSKKKKQANAFFLENDIRQAIFSQSEKIVNRLEKAVDINEKTVLLPNVMTRNVLQDAYFNCHTYVAGPSEVEYIKKLKDQYRFHGVKPAKIKSRMSLIILSNEQQQTIKSLGFKIKDFKSKSLNVLEKEFLINKSDIDLKKMEKEIREKKENFLQSLPQGNSIFKLEKLLFKQLKHLTGEHRKKLKLRYAEELMEIKKLSHWIRPYDKPQERIFNGLLMINKWGFDWVKTLSEFHQFKEKILILPNKKNADF